MTLQERVFSAHDYGSRAWGGEPVGTPLHSCLDEARQLLLLPLSVSPERRRKAVMDIPQYAGALYALARAVRHLDPDADEHKETIRLVELALRELTL